MIHPCSQIHFAGADRLAFCRQRHAGVGRARRLHRNVDGEALAAEHLARNGDAFQAQSGLGASGQGHGIDGYAQLPGLPDGARHGAQILIAVGDQQQARHHARGQCCRTVADGRLQIRPAPRRARRLTQLPAVLRLLLQRDHPRAAREWHDPHPVPPVPALHFGCNRRFPREVFRRHAG